MIYTGEAKQHTHPGRDFADHDFTAHSKGEYVKREKPQGHTNTVQDFYGTFKRGMNPT